MGLCLCMPPKSAHQWSSNPCQVIRGWWMNNDLLFSAKIVRLEVIEEEPQTRDCGKTAQPCTQKREKIGSV